MLLFCVLSKATLAVCLNTNEEGRTKARIISNQALPRTNIMRE